jgi:hypothetical protein
MWTTTTSHPVAHGEFDEAGDEYEIATFRVGSVPNKHVAIFRPNYKEED